MFRARLHPDFHPELRRCDFRRDGPGRIASDHMRRRDSQRTNEKTQIYRIRKPLPPSHLQIMLHIARSGAPRFVIFVFAERSKHPARTITSER